MLKWNDDFLVGLEKIDNEHKMIFNSINNLLLEIENGKSKEEISKALDFIEDYIARHFKEEENMLINRNKKAYKIQYEQHEMYKKEIVKLRHDFQKNGIKYVLAVETQRIIGIWCSNHILKIDKELLTLIKE